MTTLGRLKDPEQFANVIIRTTPEGRIIRIRDVGRVVLGAKNEDLSCRCNGLGSAGLIIFQLPDANALEVGDAIRAKMEELSKNFPDDLTYVIRYDTTPFTRQCIEEVVKALRDAIILVALVVLLFLQNWRSAIIPLIAVPVAIVGTFAVMKVMGFSLNNLTLFGLVLAIGIVVDDAIVVVEAVEHHIENGMLPRDATLKAMSQVSGPVIAVGLVLSAVFVPCAFISGITGQFFRQFALTIAASTVISAFNSLTLSPALSAMLLRPRRRRRRRAKAMPRAAPPGLRPGGRLGGLGTWLGPLAGRAAGRPPGAPAGDGRGGGGGSPGIAAVAGAVAGWLAGRPLNYLLGRAFRLFNDAFARATSVYLRGVGMLLRTSGLVLLVYCGMLALTYWSYVHTPKGFVPTQDMGYLLLAMQLPDAASAERTAALAHRVEKILQACRASQNAVTYNGQSFLLSVNGSNFGSMFVRLDDFRQAADAGLLCRRDRQPAAAEAGPGGARGQDRHRRGAADPRRGPNRRVQIRGGGPGRPRLEVAGATDRQPRGQRQPAPGTGRPSAVDRPGQRVPRQRPADLRGCKPQAVHDDGRAAWATCSTPCRSTSARSTSTTSTSTAAPGR